ncbi:MAG: response regulator [Halothermotrichaceae bacterium]
MIDKKILVVDDEKNVRLTLDKALSNKGYQVETAINGEEGLEKVEESNFHVILLDMKMPGLDGIDVLKELKDMNIDSRVVMITGFGSVETAVETMKLGAVDYLRKPFKPSEILEVVEDVFERIKLDKSGEKAASFKDYLHLAKSEINKYNFNEAVTLLKKATAINSDKPEPFNLLGIIYELKNKQAEAMKMYRAALALDPSYQPASDNLQRASEMNPQANLEDVNLGEGEE